LGFNTQNTPQLKPCFQPQTYTQAAHSPLPQPPHSHQLIAGQVQCL